MALPPAWKNDGMLWCFKCWCIKEHEPSFRPYPTHHVTCYCYVLDERSTCCVEGFYNLLLRLPQLAPILRGRTPNRDGFHQIKSMSAYRPTVEIPYDHSKYINMQCDRIVEEAETKLRRRRKRDAIPLCFV